MTTNYTELELKEAAENIAQEMMGIDTLERQWLDRLDFHDVAVWTLEAALIEAIKTGARLAEAGHQIK